MRKALLASVSAVALSCSAVMPVNAAPPRPPMPTWTGFYVGLNGGYAWGKSDPSLIGSVTVAPFGFTGTTQAPPGLSPRGFIGGGQAGYNWQTGQWVYGVEVDFSGLDTKADATVNPFFVGKSTRNTITWSSRYDWLFTARLRGGVAVAPNWLVYVTGGLAVTHVHDSAVCSVPPGGGTCGDFNAGAVLNWSSSSTLAGGVIGGGLETMFAPNWSARVEYLYAKFKDTTPGIVDPPVALAPIPALFSFHHDLNIVRFGINYKFGG